MTGSGLGCVKTLKSSLRIWTPPVLQEQGPDMGGARAYIRALNRGSDPLAPDVFAHLHALTRRRFLQPLQRTGSMKAGLTHCRGLLGQKFG